MTSFLFGLDNLQKHRIIMLLMVLVITASFLLVGAVIYFDEYNNYSKNSCNRLLAGGIENTGIIYDNISDFEKLPELYKELLEIEGIKIITRVSSMHLPFENLSGEMENRLVRLQKEHLEEAGYGGFYFYGIDINKNGWDLCNVKLAKGEEPDKIDIKPNEFAVYLGSGFSDIPVGTRLPLEGGTVFVVQGILQEGQEFVNYHLWTAKNYDDDSCVNLDYQALLVMPDDPPVIAFDTIHFFSVEDGADFDAITKEMQQVCEKHDALFLVGKLEDIFGRIAVYHGRELVLFKMLMAVVLLSIVVIQTCTQMAEILQNQKEYGIFYANGMNFRQLAGIVFTKNIIAFVLGFFLAVGLGIGAMMIAAAVKDNIEPQWNIVFEYAAVKIMTVQVLTFVAGLIVPLVWLYRLRPAQLIGGEG